MKQPGNETADIVLKKLDEQYQKYKFMELNLTQKKEVSVKISKFLRLILHRLKLLKD